MTLIPPQMGENPLRTVVNYIYSKVNFSHPSGLTVIVTDGR